MGYIYKITNQINGKVYIGQTKGSITERWKEHLKCYKNPNRNKRPLYKAFSKYGLDKFSIEVIEECPNTLLTEKEIYYINCYDSYGKKGYNATKGGEGNQTLLVDGQQVIKTYQRLQNLNLVAKEFNLCRNTVKSILKQNNISIQNSYNHRKRGVVQMNLEGIVLNSFDSIKEATIMLNISINSTSHISGCCRGERKSAFGFKWKYKHDMET